MARVSVLVPLVFLLVLRQPPRSARTNPHMPSSTTYRSSVGGLVENPRRTDFRSATGPLPHPSTQRKLALGRRVGGWAGAAMRWKAHSKSVLRSKARLPPAEPVRARQAGLPEMGQAEKITATTSVWAIRATAPNDGDS